MKAITLHQPWATWIALGYKTIETRTHDRFRSLRHQRIAIHASRMWDGSALYTAQPYLRPEQLHGLSKGTTRSGCVVCTAYVVGCRLLRPVDAQDALCPCEGLFGLILKDIEPLKPPIPATGHQGIWTWDPNAKPPPAWKSKTGAHHWSKK